jgi:Fe2+ transport system protein FeoA
VIISIHDVRLAIGRGMADRLWVRAQ